jgi:HicB-like protein involved in pilus formation
MPQSLHAELASAADREEVSLNQFITSSLASTVGWAGPGEEQPPEPTPEGRWMPVAMVANLVIVGLAGTAAVVLLIVALTHGF